MFMFLIVLHLIFLCGFAIVVSVASGGGWQRAGLVSDAWHISRYLHNVFRPYQGCAEMLQGGSRRFDPKRTLEFHTFQPLCKLIMYVNKSVCNWQPGHPFTTSQLLFFSEILQMVTKKWQESTFKQHFLCILPIHVESFNASSFVSSFRQKLNLLNVNVMVMNLVALKFIWINS